MDTLAIRDGMTVDEIMSFIRSRPDLRLQVKGRDGEYSARIDRMVMYAPSYLDKSAVVTGHPTQESAIKAVFDLARQPL